MSAAGVFSTLSDHACATLPAIPCEPEQTGRRRDRREREDAAMRGVRSVIRW